jgi:hypothetical protein
MMSLDQAPEYSAEAREFSASPCLHFWLRIDAHDCAHRSAKTPSLIAS